MMCNHQTKYSRFICNIKYVLKSLLCICGTQNILYLFWGVYVENQIPGKHVPLKNKIPLGDTRILEYEEVKVVCTYADVVYAGTATDRLSNEEDGIKSKKSRLIRFQLYSSPDHFESFSNVLGLMTI